MPEASRDQRRTATESDLLDELAAIEAADPVHDQVLVKYPDGMTLTRCCGALHGSTALQHHLAGRDPLDYLPQTYRDLLRSKDTR